MTADKPDNIWASGVASLFEADLMEYSDAEKQTIMWRGEIATKLGLPVELAMEFANGRGDLHRLSDIISAGCDPSLAFRIVHEPSLEVAI
jgi:hypothetical protein